MSRSFIVVAFVFLIYNSDAMSNLVKKSDCLTLSSEGIMADGHHCLSLR